MVDRDNTWREKNPSRRTFLKSTGAIGAAGVVAGCLGADDPDDPDDPDDVDPDVDRIPDEYVEADPAGEPVEEVVYENLDADFPVRFRYGEEHAGDLREIGFDVDYNVRALGAHLDETFTGRNQDISVHRWLDGFDPDVPLRNGASASTIAEGGGNVANHWNPEYEDLLQAQATAADQDERQDLVYDGQHYLVEEEVVQTPTLVQYRAMPYNVNRVSGVHEFLEDGLAGITNMVNVETPDGELRTAQQEDITTLDPLSAQRGRADRDHTRLIWDRLAHPTPDAEYLPDPWAAESIEMVDDTTMEVTLREGLEWHDGEPVTAEDVEFTYTYGAEHNAGLAGATEALENIIVESELEITFELSRPDAAFTNVGISGRDSHLIPKHVLEDVDNPDGWVQDDDIPSVGSGPFELDEFRIGEEVILTSHDEHQFAPNIDRLVRVQSADAASAAGAVEDETVDMVPYDLPPDQLDRLEAMDHIEILESVMTSLHYTTYNMHPNKDGPFRFHEVRDAVAHTNNRENWLDVAAAGYGELLTTLMSPGLEFWAAPPDVVNAHEFDLDTAVEKLGEAGFRWDEDGVIHYPEDTGQLTTQAERWSEHEDEIPDQPIPFEG